MTDILETMMLVCFGLSWPLSVIKNIKAKSAKNMSLKFTLLIISGYICGILAKILNGVFNYVLVVYFINLIAVSCNVVVYFVNKKYDKQNAMLEAQKDNAQAAV